MRTTLAVSILAVALAAPASPALAMTDSPDKQASYVVTLAPGVASAASLVSGLVGEYGGTLGFTYTHALQGFSASLSKSAAQQLAANPLVAAVERDPLVRLSDVQGGAQYSLDRTDQRTGLDGKYTYNATGAGVTAYVLDTGIRPTHVDFGGRASAGFDAVGGQNGIDCHGHGTHVAGSVVGTTWGIAKQAKVVGVRVLDCAGSGSGSQIIAGIDWVAANARKPAVANMSLGTTTGRSTAIETAVRNLVNSGVPTAVAAGNGNALGLAADACGTSPAAEPTALTTSAVDSSDTKASFANYGTCVDLFAGGVNIKSPSHSSDTGTATMSGTSMASPHVAGAAALYLGVNPTHSPTQVASALTSQATTGAVKSAGSGSPNRLLYTAGISGGGGPGNAAPVASFTVAKNDLTATFTDTSTDSDGTIATRAWNFGDSTSGSGSPVSRTYAAAGTYTVTLTVTDNAGATGSTSQQITVTAPAGSDPDPATPTLTSGVTKSDTSAASGGWKYYKVAVPTSGRTVALSLTGPSCGLLGCSPDLDLFGRNGAKPTLTTKSCSAETGSNNESCTISNAPAGYVYVGVYTYTGSAGATFTIKATVT